MNATDTRRGSLLDKDGIHIDEMLGVKTDCPCGREHSCPISRVVIRHGALDELVALCAEYRHILLVCDKNTYRVCGARVAALLGDKIAEKRIYEGDGLVVPNEASVRMLEDGVCERTDLIIGVGSGVINDLCKYVSHAHGLPYYIVATAPSMDGYASKGAAMLFDGMKVTTSADVPRAIIADTAVLKDAPMEMLQAGYGDIIGKYSCLNDWRLAHLILGEPLCEFVYDMILRTVNTVAGMGSKIVSRDEESIATLMRALVIIGVGMAYVGTTRPGSGSEHHLSHFFEVTGLLFDQPYYCHGIDVAFSTYVTATVRRDLLKIRAPKKKAFDKALWEKNIYRVYATDRNTVTAGEIVALQNKIGWINGDLLPIYREKWDEICRILADSPSPSEILAMLLRIGLHYEDFEKMYTEEKIADAKKYAKDLKDRYTVLWLYEQVV